MTTTESAEGIARLIHDLTTSNWGATRSDPVWVDWLIETVDGFDIPIVDATAIYESLIGTQTSASDLDCVAPPFERCAIGFDLADGRTHLAVFDARETDDELPSAVIQDLTAGTEWDRVRWVLTFSLFMREEGHTFGPYLDLTCPVYDTGQVAESGLVVTSHLTDPDDGGVDHEHTYVMNMALAVLCTLNFLNCRNIELVDVHGATRAERRRLKRTGIQVKTLVVKPVGRSGPSRPGTGAGVPLTSVRGHNAHYGDCCPGRHDPRGLLFGKYTGRVWVPQHARGTEELGEHRNDYRIVP